MIEVATPLATMSKPPPDDVTVEQLAALYRRNGYVRRPPEKRPDAQGSRRTHRGYEVRLVASSRSELREIRALLRRAGFRAGRPFAKANQFRLPVYGRDEVKRFLELIGEPED